MNVLIPMAGLGSRFSYAGYALPKPMILMNGKPMLERVMENLYHPSCRYTIVINEKQIQKIDVEKIVRQITNNFEIVVLDYVPKGPAMSCLQAKILDDEPLMIINCDQIIMDFDWKIFNYFIKTKKPEAILGVFHNTSPKNSYVKLNEKGEVVLVKEKAVISNMATTGLHFWTRGGLFLNSVKQMIDAHDTTNGEFYVAPSFNYLPKGAVILPFAFNLHCPIGTPSDLEFFIQKYYEI